jgi:tetratricopeptide (TPR) repeat protein
MPRLRLNRQPTIITRADRARAAGEWQHAAGLYRIALERTPNNPPIWIQYGHALKESGSLAEAETAYRTAIAYQPADADAHLQLGHALKLQGKRAEAEAAYRQAWLLDPSSADAARELAGFGWTKERLAEAAVDRPVSRSGGRHGREGLITRADRARSARQWPVAARLYRKALDRNPDNPLIWVQYGHALKESGDPAAAERAYRAALSYAPGVADTHLQLGHVLKLQGKTGEAQAAYLRAFALDPALPHPGVELGGLGWSESQLRELRSWRADDPGFAAPRDFEFAAIQRDPIARSQPDGEEYSARPDDIEWVIETIRAARLFDETYYRNGNPDLAADIDPAAHFVRWGAAEGRRPHPCFDPAYYLRKYPDVARSGVNPLLHYQLRGMKEGRSPADLSYSDWCTLYDTLCEDDRAKISARISDLTHKPLISVAVVVDDASPELVARAGFGTREAQPASIEARVRASGLFEHEVYLSLNPDLSFDRDDAWHHYLTYGYSEGRPFTSPEGIARLLAEMEPELRAERYRFKMAAEAALAGMDNRDMVAPLRRRGLRVGVFCSSIGNFFMREIADLFAWGLEGEGLPAIQRDETGSPEEPFDLRVFVAPHEFFWLGAGREWAGVAGAANSIMYNVEQAQTQWFGRAVPLLLKAPLVLDINFQTVEILRRAGCNAVHFMPGHLAGARYARPRIDISEIELTKGYRFARQPYNWFDRDRLEDRPIDLLFVGSAAPRRDMALSRLQDLADAHRFLCVYRGRMRRCSARITARPRPTSIAHWASAPRSSSTFTATGSAISSGRAWCCRGSGRAPAWSPIPGCSTRCSSRTCTISRKTCAISASWYAGCWKAQKGGTSSTGRGGRVMSGHVPSVRCGWRWRRCWRPSPGCCEMTALLRASEGCEAILSASNIRRSRPMPRFRPTPAPRRPADRC